MAESANFRDKVAERCARRPVADQAAYEKKLEIKQLLATEHTLTAAGFEIEHERQPGKGKALFIVARKPAG